MSRKCMTFDGLMGTEEEEGVKMVGASWFEGLAGSRGSCTHQRESRRNRFQENSTLLFLDS